MTLGNCALTTAIASLAILVLAFPGYGLLLRAAVRLRRRRDEPRSDETPPVTLIISAFNEEEVIREKLENSASLDYPFEQLSVLVVSDASTDATDSIVEEFAARDPRFRLLRQTQRQGKTSGLNRAVSEVATPFVVFSDANAIYEPDALREILAPFADERVGYVVGAALYTDDPGTLGGRTEGRYWSSELRLKKLESDLSSVVGGDGAIYAIRKDLYEPLRETDINDFVNPMQIVCRGYRGVFEPRARCREETTGSFTRELRRKRRIVNRSFTGLLRTPRVLDPFRFGWFALQVLCHKVLRWFSPLLALAVLVSSSVAAGEHPWLVIPVAIAWCALAIMGLMLAGVLPGRSVPGLTEPVFALGVALSSVLGILDSLRGRVATTWETRAPELAPPPAARRDRDPWPVASLTSTLFILALALSLLVAVFLLPRTPWVWVGLGISLLATIGPFFVYAPLLKITSKLRRPPPPAPPLDHWPTTTLIVAAFNEEKVIREKIENALRTRYSGEFAIVVASDGSDDETDRIVESFRARGVRLFRNEQRTGKAGLLRRALEHVGSEIVVFSDANAYYDPEAVERLVERFADLTVGAVTGAVELLAPGSAGTGREVWLSRLEKQTTRLESEYGSCVGVDGAMVAVRRELVPQYRDGTVLDDFALAMSVANRGRRVVYEPAARGWETSVTTLSGELERRARILAGIVQLYTAGMGLPLARSGLLWRFLGHKVGRWCAPAFSIVFALYVLRLLGPGLGIGVLGGAFVSLFLVLWWRFGCRHAAHKIGYLLVYQLALACGLYRGIRKSQSGAWQRTER